MKRMKWNKSSNCANIEHVVKAICDSLLISDDELRSNNRSENLIIARRIVCSYARRVIGMKYKQIEELVCKKRSSIILSEVGFDKLMISGDKKMLDAYLKFRIKLKEIDSYCNTLIPIRVWARRKDFQI